MKERRSNATHNKSLRSCLRVHVHAGKNEKFGRTDEPRRDGSLKHVHGFE